MGSGFLAKIPGSAGLVLVEGVRHIDEEAAVFEAMLTGWENQQKSRMLSLSTITPRIALIRRFNDFAESYPWGWTASDVEDFTVSLTSDSGGRLAPATIRGYHLVLRMFCDYLLDGRYEWVRQCRDRFGRTPSQVCHEWKCATRRCLSEWRWETPSVRRRSGGLKLEAA